MREQLEQIKSKVFEHQTERPDISQGLREQLEYYHVVLPGSKVEQKLDQK